MGRLLAIALAQLLPAFAQDGKLAVPSAPDLKKAETEIRGLFKDEFSQKDRESKRSLAQRLLQQAGDAANSATSRYAALGLARDLALEELDVKTAFAAVDQLDVLFALAKPPLTGLVFKSNGNAVKIHGLNGAQKFAATLEDVSTLGEAYLAVAEAALKDSFFDDALSCAQAADKYARASKAPAVLDKAGLLLKEIPELRKEDEQFAKIIVAKTDDAAAKLVKGRYALFVGGDEKAGIASLAECSDEGLKKVAKLEAAAPAAAGPMAEIGEAWIALSDKESNPLHKRRYSRRGMRWFDDALKAAQGLDKVKIEKRLAELAAKGKPVIPWVELLPLVNTKKDIIEGMWEKSGTRVLCSNGKFARLELPYEPPDEYDLKAVIETGAPTEATVLAVFRGRGFAVSLYIGDNRAGIFTSGTAVDIPNTTLPADRPVTLILQVRLNSVNVVVNDKSCLEWKPDPKTLVHNGFWAPRNPKQLGVGCNGPKVTFTSVGVVDVAGRGKRLR